MEIQERGLSPFSVSSYIRHLRIVLRWAQGEGEVPAKVDMKSPKQPRRDLRGLTLTEPEVKAMADAAASPRDELIVRLLFYTGIRLGELRRLRDGDVMELPQGGVALKVRGKTGERLVPVPPAIHKLMTAWLRKRPATAGGWIFPTIRRNRVGEYSPVSGPHRRNRRPRPGGRGWGDEARPSPPLPALVRDLVAQQGRQPGRPAADPRPWIDGDDRRLVQPPDRRRQLHRDAEGASGFDLEIADAR